MQVWKSLLFNPGLGLISYSQKVNAAFHYIKSIEKKHESLPNSPIDKRSQGNNNLSPPKIKYHGDCFTLQVTYMVIFNLNRPNRPQDH